MSASTPAQQELSDSEVSQIAIKIVRILNYTLERQDISLTKKKEIVGWFKEVFEK